MTRSPIRRLRIADADFVCSVRASASGALPASVVFAAHAPGRRLRMRFSSAPAQRRQAALGDGLGDSMVRDGWQVLDAATLPAPEPATP